MRQGLQAGLPLVGTARGARTDPNIVVADVLDARQMQGVLQGVDVLIHAAGLAHQHGLRVHTAAFDAVNRLGTEVSVRIAAKCGARHVVLVSSSSVYGPGSGTEHDEGSACHPVGAYGVSKLHAEEVAADIAERHGVGLTILRLATLYGEGDPGNVGRLLRAVDRRRFLWIGDGSNRKSLLHREDAARACLLACTEPGRGTSVLNVVGGTYRMSEIVTTIAAALRRSVPRFRVPGGLATAVARVLDGAARKGGAWDEVLRKWLADDIVNGERMAASWGFRAQVPLADGVRRQVEWYLERSGARSG